MPRLSSRTVLYVVYFLLQEEEILIGSEKLLTHITAPGFFRLLYSERYIISHFLLNDIINHRRATVSNTGVTICPQTGR